MSPYELFLHRDAVEALRAMQRDHQRRLSIFLDSLASNPSQAGDYTERDATQREIQIKIIAIFAVTYWTDHAAKEVKIVAIAKAD